MKQKFLLISFLLASPGLQAQYFGGDNTTPVKLADVIAQHQHKIADDGSKAENGRKEEGLNYHFQRWLWYWKSHTDEQGNLVSPLKTFMEWKKYSTMQSKTTAGNMSDWKLQGPSSSSGGYHGVGRINNIAFHPTNPNTYWVCTAGGGLWKTTNDGASWAIQTGGLPVLGTSDLAVNPVNPNTMYLCTGDRDASDTYSIGVMKSTDGGATWNPTGLTWTTSQMRLTNAIQINRLDTSSLTLATSNGMYKSFNGGTTWSLRTSGNFKQVVYHPVDTNVLYATTYGNSPCNIYRSKDGGMTWNTVTMTGGSTNRNRITLAVTPANVAIVKAIVVKTNGGLEGFYNSTDTGKTFTRIYTTSGSSGCNGDLISGKNAAPYNTCGNQGWYDLSIAIDPNDQNKVIVGGVNSWMSFNGGTTWRRVTQWWAQAFGVAEVHADKHWQAFHPLVANKLFECNDGGIYKTINPDSNSVWTDITNGMSITQFYRNGVASAANFVLGGSQDNGTKMLTGATTWTDPSGGDGMDCHIDPVDPTTYYTAYQNGDINRFSATWGDDDISGNIPGNPAGAWITPYVISPHNHDHLFAGYRHIYYSTDAGDSWISISGKNVTTNNFERLAMALTNDSTIYAVPDNNSKKVFYTHVFAGDTVAFDSLTCPNAGSNITDIKVDPKDHRHIWVTLGGYNSDQVVEYHFNTNTWTKKNTNLPNFPVHCIDIDTSNDIMYVGTDVGVFYMDTVTKQWEPFNTNLPSIEVADLGLNYTTKEIWAATYGRGMWKSIKQEYLKPNDTTDTPNVITIIPYVVDDVTIAPNPSQGSFSVKTENSRLFGKQAELIMLDNAGKMVWRNEQVFDGAGMIYVNTTDIAHGIYFFQITQDGDVVGRKRIVIR